MRWLMFSMAVVGLAFAFGISGCSRTATTKPSATTPGLAEQEHEHTDHPEGDAANADVTAALAELSAEDRVLAENQKICPVSGEPLGAMGAPIKLDVKGQPVFICCEGCKDKLLSKPDEYLAKLKK